MHNITTERKKGTHKSSRGAWRWAGALTLLLIGLLPALAMAQRPDILWMGGGHRYGAASIAISPDGILASVGYDYPTVVDPPSFDGTLKVWRLSDGGLMQTILGKFSLVAFSADGRTLAVYEFANNPCDNCGANGTIKVWRVSEGRPSFLRNIAAGGTIGSLAFSPDGELLAAAEDRVVCGCANSAVGWIRLWRIEDGRLLQETPTDISQTRRDIRANSIAFSPDGQTLASGHGCGVTGWPSGEVRLRPVMALRSVTRALTLHTNDVKTVAYSPDGQLLASGSADSTIKILSVRDLTPLCTLSANAPVHSVAFSPDGDMLGSGDGQPVRPRAWWDTTPSAGAAKLWRVSDCALLYLYSRAYTKPVTSVAFTPDGQWLATGSYDATVRMWSVPDGQSFQNLPGHTDELSGIAFSPDGEIIASASQDGTVKLRSAADGTLLKTIVSHNRNVNALAFSPDGQQLAVAGREFEAGSYRYTVKLWRLYDETGRRFDDTLIRTFSGHTQEIRAVAFAPDGRAIASASDAPEQAIRLWDVERGETLRTINGHAGGITSLVVYGDGRLAAASRDGVVKLWNVEDGTVIWSCLAPSDGVVSIAFSPDGQRLAGGWTNKILVWQVGEGTCSLERTIEDNFRNRQVNSLAFSPDGLLLASAGADATVKLRRVADWSTARSYDQETHLDGMGVLHVTFSPDGSQFAYARWDPTVVMARTPEF